MKVKRSSCGDRWNHALMNMEENITRDSVPIYKQSYSYH